MKKFVTVDKLEEFKAIMEEIKEDHGSYNITYAAKRFCLNNGYPYDDNVRRKFSKLLEKAGEISDQELIVTEETFTSAKVVFFDIETSLMEALVFSPWNNYKIPSHRIVKDWNILCFSANWLGESEVERVVMTEEELKNSDDRRVTKALWNILDKASVVVAHNGQRFDIPKANAKFLEHGFGLPSPYEVVDTFKLAKKNLAPTYLSLDYLSKLTGSEGKLDSNGLWDRIAKGEYKALQEMAEYCDKDVIELRRVFLELRPYLKGLPNMGLHVSTTEAVCHACGSTDLLHDVNYTPYRTTVNEYTVVKCACCGSYSKDRIAIKNPNKVKTTPLHR